MLQFASRLTSLTIAKYVCLASRIRHFVWRIAIGFVVNSPHSTFSLPPAFSTDSKCAGLIFTLYIATDRPFTSLEILCSDARAAITICCTSIHSSFSSWRGMARSSTKAFTTSAGIPISSKSSRIKGLLRLARPSKIDWALPNFVIQICLFFFCDFQNTASTVKCVPFSVNLLLVPLVVFWPAGFTLINDWSTLHFTEHHQTFQTSENDLPFWDEITREWRIAHFLSWIHAQV